MHPWRSDTTCKACCITHDAKTFITHAIAFGPLPCFHSWQHCTKQKRPHADLFRGRACTTNLHIPHFLNRSIRARKNDQETKTLEPVTRSPMVQRNMETRRGTRHGTSADENYSKNNWKRNSVTQSRQPFSAPWALMIEHQTHAAQQLTKTTQITNGHATWFPTQPTPLQKPPTHHPNQNVQIVHRSVRNYGHACVGPASEAARN